MKKPQLILLTIFAGLSFLSMSIDVSAAEELGTGTGMGMGNADVLEVKAEQTAAEIWTFRVRLSHPDTGWEDYADGWDVVLPDGTVSKPNKKEKFTRTLWHPHVNEQPFTRLQAGVIIPETINEVVIRAHDKPDGFGGKTIRLNLDLLRTF